jgi:hypothetical protein
VTGLTLSVGDGEPLFGLPIYANSEHSFRFEVASPDDLEVRSGNSGRTSLSIGTLQIEIDVERGEALFVWGLHPRQRWVLGNARPGEAQPGTVRVTSDGGLRRGVSIRVADIGSWTTVHDPESGWVRITASPMTDDDEQVLIATGTILGLRLDCLNSVWLAPAFEGSEP